MEEHSPETEPTPEAVEPAEPVTEAAEPVVETPAETVDAAEPAVAVEPPVTPPKTRRRVSKKWLAITAVLVLNIAVGATTSYLLLNPKKVTVAAAVADTGEKSKAIPLDDPSAPKKTATAVPSADVKRFTTPLSRSIWSSITPSTGELPGSSSNDYLSMTSPPFQFTDADGVTSIVAANVTITSPKSDSYGYIFNGDDTIRANSEPLTYANPTSAQRKQTNLSFSGYSLSDNKAITAMFVSGSFSYKNGDSVGSHDYKKVDPSISMYIDSCYQKACQGFGPAGFTIDDWDNNADLQNVKTNNSITEAQLMKRLPFKKIALVLVVLITLSNGGVLAYLVTHRPTTTEAVQASTTKAPAASIGIKSAKQVDIGTGTEGTLSGTGNYDFESLAQSRINSTDYTGSLVLATYQPLGANFILADSSTVTFDNTNVNKDWQTSTISNDSLWAPAACSSKPTLVLKSRYIFIDDGKTNPTDTYNSYLVFDIQKNAYNYFGGDSFSATQAKHENIMLVTNENDQLVFYIDPIDQKGPLASSTSFKHAAGYDPGYIIRRVIDPATMQYKDYHVAYTVPQGTQFYYLSASAGINGKGPNFYLADDANDASYTGSVAKNAVAFSTPEEDQPTVTVQSNGPYDTDIEKLLNAALTTELPALASGEKYNQQNYKTNFSITELGQHDTTKFIVATSRNGTQKQTPAVVDDANGVHALTGKPILDFGAYVPIGVY